MQAIEFESIIENRFIPVPESARLTSGLPVRVIVLFDEVKQSASKSKADPEIADFFGCLPNFPERDLQGEYEQRDEL
jgi:hypothetical protein